MTRSPAPSKLLNCPFCGEAVYDWTGDLGYRIGCGNCHYESWYNVDNRAGMYTAWNTRATPQQDGWKPIESAPKDGTWILVIGERFMDEDLPAIGLTKWEEAESEFWQQTNRKTKKLIVEDRSEWNLQCGISPTHWQPLPHHPSRNGKKP